MRVVDLEMLLDKRPLVFAQTVDRREQILGIDFVVDLLVAACVCVVVWGAIF